MTKVAPHIDTANQECVIDDTKSAFAKLEGKIFDNSSKKPNNRSQKRLNIQGVQKISERLNFFENI